MGKWTCGIVGFVCGAFCIIAFAIVASNEGPRVSDMWETNYECRQYFETLGAKQCRELP